MGWLLVRHRVSPSLGLYSVLLRPGLCVAVLRRLGGALPLRPPPAAATPLAARLRRRQRDNPAEIGVSRALMRDRHRLDEMRLEFRLDGSLDLLDPPHQGGDRGPR